MNIKKIIKGWLGVQDDIEKAKREAREEVVKELTDEKAAAIKKPTAEKESEVKELCSKLDALQLKLDAATANAELANVAARKAEEEKFTAIQKFTEEKSAMVDALKKSEEEWRKEKEQYSNLLKILDSFKEEMKQQEEKSGPGRPRKNVITKAFTIDKGLNSIIGFLELTHIIKKGEMTKVIHECLWEWVAPYQKMFEEYYSKPESAKEDTAAAVPTNTEGSAALSK